jgi:hypothetical protein
LEGEPRHGNGWNSPPTANVFREARTSSSSEERIHHEASHHRDRRAVADFAVLISSGAFAGSAATADPSHGGGHTYGFERFLERYEAANTAFVNGDPSLWSKITAEKDPASIFGGFGGLGEAGVDEVTQRYELAAGAFRPSGADVDFEYLVKDVRGRLAYTVALERANVLYAGQTELQAHFLRATMIFRFDRGG